MNLLLDRNESTTNKLARTPVSFVSTVPTDEELFSIRCPLEPNTDQGGNSPSQDSCEADWFELALQTEAPRPRPIPTLDPIVSSLAPPPVKNSWGDDEEESDEELPEDESKESDDDPDPFEDFDEEDFDDDFDDDFEEELEDEYEIEPKDDGFAIDEGDDSDESVDDEDGDEIPE